jgi:hypothetical protein
MKYHRKTKRGKEKAVAPAPTGIDYKKREDRFDRRIRPITNPQWQRVLDRRCGQQPHTVS